MKASLDVANESMGIAGKQAYELATPVFANDSGCEIALCPSMHLGIAATTIQTRVSMPQSILNPGGYWIMCSMIASATPAANGRKLDGILTQRSSNIIGPSIKTPALPTIVEPLSPWNPPGQLRSEKGRFKHTT